MVYLAILLFFLLTSLFLEWKYRIRLYQSRKERFIVPLVFVVIGAVWDTIGVVYSHWQFNFENLLGVRIGSLPLEEYLFFLIVPYGILTYHRVLVKEIKG